MIHKAISILRKKFLRKQFEKFKYTLQKKPHKIVSERKKTEFRKASEDCETVCCSSFHSLYA